MSQSIVLWEDVNFLRSIFCRKLFNFVTFQSCCHLGVKENKICIALVSALIPLLPLLLPALKPLLNAGEDSIVALDLEVCKDNLEAARICLECFANLVSVLEREKARVNKAATE